jgi:hypothetical protein
MAAALLSNQPAPSLLKMAVVGQFDWYGQDHVDHFRLQAFAPLMTLKVA